MSKVGRCVLPNLWNAGNWEVHLPTSRLVLWRVTWVSTRPSSCRFAGGVYRRGEGRGAGGCWVGQILGVEIFSTSQTGSS